jgi:hypothetical protein
MLLADVVGRGDFGMLFRDGLCLFSQGWFSWWVFSGLRGFHPWINPQSSKLRRVVRPRLEAGEASRAIKKHRQRTGKKWLENGWNTFWGDWKSFVID